MVDTTIEYFKKIPYTPRISHTVEREIKEAYYPFIILNTNKYFFATKFLQDLYINFELSGGEIFVSIQQQLYKSHRLDLTPYEPISQFNFSKPTLDHLHEATGSSWFGAYSIPFTGNKEFEQLFNDIELMHNL